MLRGFRSAVGWRGCGQFLEGKLSRQANLVVLIFLGMSQVGQESRVRIAEAGEFIDTASSYERCRVPLAHLKQEVFDCRCRAMRAVGQSASCQSTGTGCYSVLQGVGIGLQVSCSRRRKLSQKRAYVLGTGRSNTALRHPL